MPTKSNLCRIMMIGRVLLPKLSLSNRALRLVLAEVVAIVLTASLTARVLSALPGQLQALVVQADRAGWIRLMLTATGFRLLSTVKSTRAKTSSVVLNMLYLAEPLSIEDLAAFEAATGIQLGDAKKSKDENGVWHVAAACSQKKQTAEQG